MLPYAYNTLNQVHKYPSKKMSICSFSHVKKRDDIDEGLLCLQTIVVQWLVS